MFLPSKGSHNMLLLILHVPHTQKKKKEGKKKAKQFYKMFYKGFECLFLYGLHFYNKTP